MTDLINCKSSLAALTQNAPKNRVKSAVANNHRKKLTVADL